MRVVLLAALGAAVLLFAGWLWLRWHRAKERWTSRSAGTRNIAFTVMETR